MRNKNITIDLDDFTGFLVVGAFLKQFTFSVWNVGGKVRGMEVGA